jgi:hypothetical protein
MTISRFKLQIKVGGEIRWADADKVFAHLMERYVKTIPNGEMPDPYEDKVKYFFENLDEKWVIALKDAYPNVDIGDKFKEAKIWLLSNTSHPKKNFKKFVNNWIKSSKAKSGYKQVDSDPRSQYEKYKAPVSPDVIYGRTPVVEDVASPEEIKELLRRK